MEYRRFGGLDAEVSHLGFGAGGKGYRWGPADPEAFRGAVHQALDLGVSFFDTSDSYGEGLSEELLGSTLAERTDTPTVICTKFGIRYREDGGHDKDFSSEWLGAAVEASLRRLRRETIDVLLLHSPPDDFDYDAYDPAPLEELRRAGKIRCYGVSALGHVGAERAVESGFGSVVEVIYNVFDRRAESPLFERARRRDVGVIVRTPLGTGFLTRRGLGSDELAADDVRRGLPAEDVAWRRAAARKLAFLDDEPGGLSASALRFAAWHDAVTTVIPGMSNARQVRDNHDAVTRGALPTALVAAIRTAVPDVFPGWVSTVRKS